MINQKYLKSILDYDRKNGTFNWKKKISRKNMVGNNAGGKNSMGYITIGISGDIYYAHRLAYLWVYGYMPKSVDHKDGDRSNNRIANLRPCTMSQNILNSKLAKNNTSGFKGAYWSEAAQKWEASYQHNGKKNYIGLFDTPKDAGAAYLNAVKKIEPDFVREK